jgi:predicted MPP superfamily phosphohydrolase
LSFLAVQGGITGAAGGAAAGAMAGGMVERQGKQAQPTSGDGQVDIEALRKALGDLNFHAAVFLIQGNHKEAIAMANRAVAEASQTNRKVFGLTVRAVAENETGNKAAAEKTYADIAKVDPKRSIDRARGDTMQVMLKIQGLRKQHGITVKSEK